MKYPHLFKSASPLPVPNPWSQQEWSTMDPIKFSKDQKLGKFMTAWDLHTNRTEIISLYMNILWASMKTSALNAAELVARPNFDELFRPNPEERLSNEKILQMLDKAADLAVSQPNFFPGPVEWFDFLVVVSHFVNRICEKYPHLANKNVEEKLIRLGVYAHKHLFNAVSRDIGSMPLN